MIKRLAAGSISTFWMLMGLGALLGFQEGDGAGYLTFGLALFLSGFVCLILALENRLPEDWP